MRTGELYRLIRDRFRSHGLPTADLDARLLVGAALDISLSDLVLRDKDAVAAEGVSRAESYAACRLKGMPVGRILGEREFFGRRFLLNAATLEPRPDTEILVEAVLERSAADGPGLVCDIGTGTGAIAVSLLAERPNCHAVAVDLSPQALCCARQNAELNGVETRFFPLCADYASALAPGFDWVVSNPPYIRSATLAELSPEVIRHDPALALDGGEGGLEAYLKIVPDAVRILRPGGRIGLEIGFDQAAEVKILLHQHGFGEIEIIKDLAGKDRVVTARGQ
ncbi:peptide chain release factor N(5)-glutamine methyltransferase [Roseibium aggregatum]|uniref:Release factor glutamine methyltransferase n=1 Tax=Roseibium aggregatum TaxID=187304 RepID=A0A939J7K6_9HYPH|nr:peptide chain release factor N(5)-glutamine methyltransferase [Roseibium aggregatum]MBN9673934.1 peptide chain release factor N(5)-glutamine methyltransferase [Roseibium aggregatum]